MKQVVKKGGKGLTPLSNGRHCLLLGTENFSHATFSLTFLRKITTKAEMSFYSCKLSSACFVSCFMLAVNVSLLLLFHVLL